ncbi:hypothetical protein [Oceanimonas marisflavi]|uniref:hypothetical protein n=1 Tax=Oceanimonas marisflavi TaxID=2059724 RepID=UPI001300998B|nr:hypothetical protein [Oceanimonas marisflavi]
MKGWTVKTAVTKNGAKGIAARHVYLFNKKHINHEKTECITKVFGGDDAMANIVYYAERYSAEQKMRGLGGRPPSSYAMEFTLNLPKNYRPSEKQWRGIVIDCINALAKCCNVGGKELASSTLAILHQQSMEGKGTGDHVHLVVGKFTEQGNFLKNLQRKTATHVLKNTFNNSTKQRCGYDWTEYAKTLECQKCPNKKNIPSWRVKSARDFNLIDEKLNLVKSLSEQFDNKLHKTQLEKKLLERLQRQLIKWFKAKEEKDSTQKNRQKNRIYKTMSELSNLEICSEVSSVIEKINECVSEKNIKREDLSL